MCRLVRSNPVLNQAALTWSRAAIAISIAVINLISTMIQRSLACIRPKLGYKGEPINYRKNPGALIILIAASMYLQQMRIISSRIMATLSSSSQALSNRYATHVTAERQPMRSMGGGDKKSATWRERNACGLRFFSVRVWLNLRAMVPHAWTAS
jgi:hypothetical protein